MAEAKQQSYTAQLDGIRAPLGVILYLIRRDNLDIYDIPIARITKEYLDYLNMMDDTQIELAGEFFVLAATLMRIKAQMLLRRDDDTEDDPRDGLVRSLLEYKKMVEAAKTFQEMEHERGKIYMRPVPDAEKEYREDPEIDLSLFHLMRAFQDVMVHFEADDVREIELEEYTIEDKIAVVNDGLREKSQLLFTDLFAANASRMELIVTLMALLEMIKHGHVRVRQDGMHTSVWLYHGPNFGEKLESVEDWTEAMGEGEVSKVDPKDLPHDSRLDAASQADAADESFEGTGPAEATASEPITRNSTTQDEQPEADDNGRTEPQ